jgi:predicted outer membrane protein
MKVHAAIVAALVLGLARLGYTAQLNADSENFIRDTAVRSMGDVELSRWVQDRTGPDVGNFVKKVVDDHNKFNGELKTLADKYDITLPLQKMTKEQMALKDRWEKMAAAKLDRDYLSFIVDEYNGYIEDFQRFDKDGVDQGLRTFVKTYLPTFKENLNTAKGLESRLSKSAMVNEPLPDVASREGNLDKGDVDYKSGNEVSYEKRTFRSSEVNEYDNQPIRDRSFHGKFRHSEPAVYGEPVIETGVECGVCEPCKEVKCDTCSEFVYDNDWRAMYTELTHEGR